MMFPSSAKGAGFLENIAKACLNPIKDVGSQSSRFQSCNATILSHSKIGTGVWEDTEIQMLIL